jgi:hypothetical protein
MYEQQKKEFSNRDLYLSGRSDMLSAPACKLCRREHESLFPEEEGEEMDLKRSRC